jgi:septal ring factor EnvC (AmiA/AmiB activator)
MRFEIRAAALVALICLAAGCAHEPDPEPLNAVTRDLTDAQDEIAKLKAELQRTTKQLHDAQVKIADTETKMFAATQAKHDEMRDEEQAFSRLEGVERTRVLQILEKAKRGEPLTAQMVKVLDDVHVGLKYVKKFQNENLTDAERSALKGAD